MSGFAVDGLVVADAKDGDDGEEQGKDEDEEEGVLDCSLATCW